jgi:hypothetical protein
MLLRTALFSTLLLPLFLSAQMDTLSVSVVRAATQVRIPLARMKQLPAYEARIIAHEGGEATYAGVRLSDVLRLNDDIRAI